MRRQSLLLLAATLNDMGTLHREAGDYAAAEPPLREALDVRREVVGEEHPDFAGNLNELGAVCFSMGKYAAAEALYKQALDIDDSCRGGVSADCGHMALLGGVQQVLQMCARVGVTVVVNGGHDVTSRAGCDCQSTPSPEVRQVRYVLITLRVGSSGWP